MQIIMEFLPLEKMRYAGTAGDYFMRDGALVFQVADTGNTLYNKLVAIHELIEQTITEHQGVTNEAIDEWDFSHADSRDPGDELNCPYGDAHNLATGVERMITAHLRVPWKTYDEAVLGMEENTGDG